VIKILIIKNCRLYNSPDKTTDILIKNGKISKIGRLKSRFPGEETIDARGRIVAPGFIDVHIQGAGGADVLDGTVDALKTMSRTVARFGTTSFLATTVYKPGKDNAHLEIAADATGKNLGGANLLGIHLEGPFISLNKKGMIQPDCICEPSLQVLDDIQTISKGALKMMTIAPELKGSLEIIKKIRGRGIIASFAHSSAAYEETLEGIKAGITHVTHLYNAMMPIHHRAPGPLPAIFENKKLTAQIITDGVHVHPRVLNFAWDILGARRCISITDGMQAIGLPEGKYVYNGIEYESKNGAARYHDGTLIGTALGQNQLLARLMKFTGCTLEQAIKTATENPAKLLGIYNRKGSITPGKDADIVILNKDLSVFSTIVSGAVV